VLEIKRCRDAERERSREAKKQRCREAKKCRINYPRSREKGGRRR
jgi:hypothetical protein